MEARQRIAIALDRAAKDYFNAIEDDKKNKPGARWRLVEAKEVLDILDTIAVAFLKNH